MKRWVAALSWVLLGAGCGGPPPPTGDPVIVTLDERPVLRSALIDYLQANLPELPGEPHGDPAAADLVRSRLFDNFIDEQLLLLEAERRGVGVSEVEVTDQLARLQERTGDDSPEDPVGGRDAVRQEIMIQKLRAAVSFAEVTVTEREVDRYLEQHREEMIREHRAVLRFLTLKDQREATRIRLAILREGMDIDEAVEVFSTDPGHTGPLELDLEILPEEIARSIEPLQPGEISQPVVFHGQTYLFALATRGAGSGPSEPALRERARRELQRNETRAALDALIARMRAETRIDARLEQLPFRYLPAR